MMSSLFCDYCGGYIGKGSVDSKDCLVCKSERHSEQLKAEKETAVQELELLRRVAHTAEQYWSAISSIDRVASGIRLRRRLDELEKFCEQRKQQQQ